MCWGVCNISQLRQSQAESAIERELFGRVCATSYTAAVGGEARAARKPRGCKWESCWRVVTTTRDHQVSDQKREQPQQRSGVCVYPRRLVFRCNYNIYYLLRIRRCGFFFFAQKEKNCCSREADTHTHTHWRRRAGLRAGGAVCCVFCFYFIKQKNNNFEEFIIILLTSHCCWKTRTLLLLLLLRACVCGREDGGGTIINKKNNKRQKKCGALCGALNEAVDNDG